VIYGQMKRATAELLELAQDAGIEPVLLKGISIADELYRPPHHRIMGDIDVLVPPDRAQELYEQLMANGYARRTDGAATPEGHHLPELRHPELGVSVEIHTGLSSRLLAGDPLLRPELHWQEARPSSFAGRACRRFTPEYQIVHTLMHWAVDQKWTVNVISINDFIHLMNRAEPAPEWRRLAGWMAQSPRFADAFTVLALYLEECGLLHTPGALAAPVLASRRRLGAFNLRILHWLLRTFPLSGRRKVGWVLTPTNTRIVWLTLLEPRHKILRPLVALSRVLFRRTRGESLLDSVAGRIRTMLQPNA
jgi:hypothetical protein